MRFYVTPQITDDVLDFTSTASTLGKPALNDLKSGLTTAPVRPPPLLPFPLPPTLSTCLQKPKMHFGFARSRTPPPPPFTPPLACAHEMEQKL